MNYWCLHDSDASRRTPRIVGLDQAKRLNAQGYGVFWVPNQWKGKKKSENCTRIRAWFCEIDALDKPQQVLRLKNLPLLPSFVIETRKGFHCYWRVRGDATLENWKRIVRWGIVPMLGADPKATDVLRLLRCAGFYHMKDPFDPYWVDFEWKSEYAYTEEQMLQAFPDRQVKRQRQVVEGSGGFWDQVRMLDCGEALERLNGHSLMRGERFDLERQSNGNFNIIRVFPSRLDTGCFIDNSGRLGGVHEGTSIVAWLRWYDHGLANIARGLKEVFPELVSDLRGDLRQ